MFRRLVAITTALALAAALAGCASTTAPTAAAKPADGSAAFPVSIHTAFGTTTIAKRPIRVATISWINDDISIALGVVPVGMPTDSYGGNKNGSLPWKDAALTKLGAGPGTAKYPKQYTETDGPNDDAVAALHPDVILAAYSGLDKQSYQKLSQIAPVVAYPKVAYGTSWQTATTMIGEALGRKAQAAALISRTDADIASAAKAHPDLAGKTFVYANIDPADAGQINLYTPQDNRPRLLTQLGMTLAPEVAAAATGSSQFFIPWSNERANELKADVLVGFGPDSVTKASLKKDPLLGQIPAVKSGAVLIQHDETDIFAISAADPLSLPWALDRFVPQLAAAAAHAAH